MGTYTNLRKSEWDGTMQTQTKPLDEETLVLDDEEYISVKRAAATLHVSQSTVWRWVNEGALPAQRIGRRRVWLKRADLASLVTPRQRQHARERPLTKKEREQLLAAIAESRRAQAEMLARRGGKRFTPSYLLIDEARDMRTQELP